MEAAIDQSALAQAAAALAADPADIPSWHRVAVLLAQAGANEAAAIAYSGLGRAAAEAGHLPLAILVAKELEPLDPVEAAEILDELAAAYAAGSRRIRAGLRPPPLRPTLRRPVATAVTPGEAVAAARAAAEAAAAALAAASTRLLPEWPLFGRLPPNAFRGLVSLCRPRKYIRGEVIIAQGEEGKSFYVLARGAVRVTRQTPDGQEIDLSRLHEGDFFGEMALIADTPRTATVTAERTVHLFEVEREGSEGLARVYPEIGRALADHCRGRLLKLLLASSPFFTQVAPEQRGELLGRFRPRVMGPGEPVMREGQPGEGLYVVASGRLRVDKIDADEPVRVATLGPGDFFGEISLLRGGGATATVTAIGQAVVLFLPRADFEQVAPDQPDLLAHIYRQSLARERENASILAAPGLRADDCLV